MADVLAAHDANAFPDRALTHSRGATTGHEAREYTFLGQNAFVT